MGWGRNEDRKKERHSLVDERGGGLAGGLRWRGVSRSVHALPQGAALIARDVWSAAIEVIKNVQRSGYRIRIYISISQKDHLCGVTQTEHIT